MEKENFDLRGLSLTRRDFLKGLAAAGLLGGSLGSGSTSLSSTTKEVKSWLPEKWDKEADVVVIGAGFAGQAAAIEADKLGASVLMLEKAAEKYAGGNSRVCGQGFLSPSPAIWDDYSVYLKAVTAGLGFPCSDDPVEADKHIRSVYLEESSKNIKWFEDMGAVVAPYPGMFGSSGGWIPFYPHMPGADSVASEPGCYRVTGDYAGSGGNWHFLDDYMRERGGIRIMYEAPAKRLVQNLPSKEVLGVVAVTGGREVERKDGGIDIVGGKEIYVKARKAVCVCAGGWEYNQQMVRDFTGIPCNYSFGSPYNTGETIKMCWAAGADIRNMGTISAPWMLSPGILPPYKSALTMMPPPEGAFMIVGTNNKRFMDEFVQIFDYVGIRNKDKSGQEGAVNPSGTMVENGVYVRVKYPMPMHMIFDEEARLSGPIFAPLIAGLAWAGQIEGYVPSPDNSAELAMGWMTRAATIGELVTKVGREPSPLFGKVPLEETVNGWNASCAAGKDLEQGRTKNLTPFTSGPFYAVELFPGCINTQGGMMRNTKSQVIDIESKVIPRLYSAGENGDIWTWIYQCMSNVGGGCYAYGRIAGQNAAAEKSWE